MSQLHIHFNIRKKDLLEVRKEMNKVRDDLRTFRTASRDPRTRAEYQAPFRAKLHQLEQQEKWLLRELRAIKSAYQQRKATVSHAPGSTASSSHLASTIPASRPVSSKEDFLRFVRSYLGR